MKIQLKQITVRDLVKDYEDDAENGVRTYGGLLDVRPPYQREFVYKDKQRDAVIETVKQGFPLNVMYWAKREDGTFEVIDGQQRTISLCQYVTGDFAYMMRYFHNLQDDEQQQILDYELMVYVCEGTDSEKLKWFETINIAGENSRSRNYVTPFTTARGWRMPSVISAKTAARRIKSGRIMFQAARYGRNFWKKPWIGFHKGRLKPIWQNTSTTRTRWPFGSIFRLPSLG